MAAETRGPGDQPGPALTTSVEASRAAYIVHVAGEIDISTVGDLETAIERAELESGTHGGTTVVIDLRGVTFLGAEGLRSLVGADHRITEAGGAMRVVAPPQGIIRRLLDLSGVGALLDLFETIDSAIPPGRD